MGKDFVHLHVHSKYSLQNSTCGIYDLIDKARLLNMKSLALTDHANMFGAMDFYSRAKDEGLKPILGIEVYVAPQNKSNKVDSGTKDTVYHLTLLAENNEGYQNLVKLSSTAYLGGGFVKPCVNKEQLKRHSKGIICLSGCMKSELNSYIRNGEMDNAMKTATEYREIFGKDNFFIELMHYGIEDQENLINETKKVSEKTGVPLVATNDIHFIEADDAKAHEILLRINKEKAPKGLKTMGMSNKELYFKTQEEMMDIFGHIPEAITNTVEISDRCNLNLEFDKLLLPHFETDENLGEVYQKGMTNAQVLRKMSEVKALEKYKDLNPTVNDRLDYELRVIEETGFVDNFLIIWDIFDFARKNNIQASPQGPVTGSLAAFVLGITDIDPIKYGFLFERFLNPERISKGDVASNIDIGFCVEGREGIKIDLPNIPINDKKTFELLSRGDIDGEFYIDTDTDLEWRDLLIELKPEKFTDIILSLVFCRPGPVLEGMTETFIKCRQGKEAATYLHPSLKPILEETHGILIYQEQLMLIGNKLANFSLNEADEMIKVMGKRKPEEMDRFENMFINGAANNDISKDIAKQIFEFMSYFAGYSCSKASFANTANIIYQIAYLKANYPEEYVAAHTA